MKIKNIQYLPNGVFYETDEEELSNGADINYVLTDETKNQIGFTFVCNFIAFENGHVFRFDSHDRPGLASGKNFDHLIK